VAFRNGISTDEKQAILGQASGNLQLASNPGSPFFDVVQVTDGGVAPTDVIAQLRGDPRVRIAEPDYIVHTTDTIPNDQYFPYLWGLRNIGQGDYGYTTCTTCSTVGADISATKAWDLTTGSSQVIVAVIDTGVDYTHPDLAPNILRDSSNNVVGYNYVSNTNDPMDDYGHGTHCAGTIGAVGNNSTGVAGICWTVKIMPVKFLDATGSGYISNAILATDFATSHGAQILSNSWGGGGFSQLFLEAILRAQKAGALFVAAAGNSGANLDLGGFYPAGYNVQASNVIAVAATDDNDLLASFSNYGPQTCDIAAPGVEIYSTLPTGSCPLCDPSGYGYLSGTSMATPHVAGAAALIKSLYPNASLTQLHARLLYAVDHPADVVGYTRSGRLNVFKALQSDTVPPGAPSNFSITQASGTGLRLSWTAAGDDNLTGTVSSYQIFYNTISDLSTATMVEPKMTPGPPGTQETFDLTGLTPNTAYYVSLCAVDKVGNVSPLVAATPVMTGGASFFDGAESTPYFTNPYPSNYPSWTVTTDDAHTGQHSYGSPANLPASTPAYLASSFTVTGPSYLTFWAKTDLDASNDYLYCIIQDMSTGNISFSFNFIGQGSTAWTRFRNDLSSYNGHEIEVEFYVYRGSSTTSSSTHRAWIDDIAIVQLTKGWMDDVEGAAQFTGFPPWAITTETSASATHSWSDSPNSNYANNLSLPLMQNSSVIPPSNLGSLSLVFKAKVDLEADRDYLYVYASPDDGSNWQYLRSITGTSDWSTYSYDLPGWKKVRALFYLSTNEAVTRDGVHIDDIGVWGEPFTAATLVPASSSVGLRVSAGGASTAFTSGSSGAIQVGYATGVVSSGDMPYGTAVFSLKSNGVTICETGVPASPPATSARIFIDYRKGANAIPGRASSGAIDINTGIAVVNYGSATAHVTYTLRDLQGSILTSGTGTIAAGNHFAKFVDQLNDVASGFNFPSDFSTSKQFGSLDIQSSDQPISVLAIRGTTNQKPRGEFLFTTTPVADLSQPASYSSIYFPDFADGDGYTTSLLLLNTSGQQENGTLQFLDNSGNPLVVNQVGGNTNSSFPYSILPNGAFHFQTDGSPADVKVGWVQITPAAGSQTPIGSGVFSYNPDKFLISESGIPSAASTTHARVYVDLSGNHDTGLAIANLSGTQASISVHAFQMDGVTEVGTSQGPFPLAANGHDARDAGQFISGLPAGFTGVLDISSTTPFAALTVRSLTNERNEYLFTTFPIAYSAVPAPSPLVFPDLADGSGYQTQFILLSGAGSSAVTLNFFGEDGKALAIGK
jgi:subtilisin family serine protease